MRLSASSRWKLVSKIVIAAAIFASTIGLRVAGSAPDDSRTFPETGKTVSGRFLEYWDANGGLAQQGFPISEEVQETSSADGQTYTVQYFERAVFELHLENEAPYDVLLSLLGSFYYNDKYGGEAPDQVASTDNPTTFPETGKTLGGVFRNYWETHGGLAQQGYPISDEFEEMSDTDGNTYRVQYFERAVFELHPEKAGTPFEVQLSLLGAFFSDSRNGVGSGGPSLLPRQTPTPGRTPVATPTPGPTIPITEVSKLGWTHMVATTNNILLFYNASNGSAVTTSIMDSGTITALRKFPDDHPGLVNLLRNATHLVAGPKNTILMYRQRSGDGVVLSAREDGALFPVTDPNGMNFGKWSNVQIDPETGLGVFYDNATGQLDTVQWSKDNPGEFQTMQSGAPAAPGTRRWKNIVPVGNGNWFFSSETPGYFSAIVASPNSSGQFVVLDEIFPFDGGWTDIAATKTRVLFYNRVEGRMITATIGPDGTFTVIKPYIFPMFLNEHLSPTLNDLLVFYEPKNGEVEIWNYDSNGDLDRIELVLPE